MVAYPQGDNTAVRYVDLSELVGLVNVSNQVSFRLPGSAVEYGEKGGMVLLLISLSFSRMLDFLQFEHPPLSVSDIYLPPTEGFLIQTN